MLRIPSVILKNRNFKPLDDKRYFIGSLISGALSLGGSLFGKSAQDEAADRADSRIIQSINELTGLPEYQYIQGENAILENVPQDLQAELIKEDPTLRATEMAALQKMQELTDKGLSAADAYNYMQAEQRTAEQSRGEQEAIINEMQRKGMSGSGLEYALRTKTAQDAVDRFAESQSAQAAKNAEQRALANLQQANMAGNMRSEDFRTSNANTSALNNFAQQNLKNRMDVNNRNINRQNLVNQGETAERRNVSQLNTSDARSLAAQKANLRQGLQASDLARGVSKSNMYGDIANTIGKIGGEAYNYFKKDKKDEEDDYNW